jgi:predicted aldo/keto reductase-like oxidoreductase
MILGRREFLKKTAAGAFGASWAALKGASRDAGEKASAPKIKEYRTLGRTGFRVSDISAGSIQDDGVLRAALDAGINYIDSAEQYLGHHRLIAKAVEGLDRKSLFITTKLEVLKDVSKEGFLTRARKCLEDLRMEYVDCLMMHMPEKAETLKTEGFHSAMNELKAAGRVRYVGVSNHGSFWFRDPEESMERVLFAAAEDGRFDVVLMAHNFLNMDQSDKVLRVCREKNIGVALMKATPIAIYYSLKDRVELARKEGKEVHPLYAEGLKRYEDKLRRAQAFIKDHNLKGPEDIKAAAIQFVLSEPDVHTVCCLPKTYEELDSFLKLSGTRLDEKGSGLLQAYREGCGEFYCRHGCGICEPTCPHGVPVNTIMRYYQYFAGRGREREAMIQYAGIPGARGDACQTCPGYCEEHCPYGVPVRGMLLAAHNRMSFP